MFDRLIVLRGGGDLGSGSALRLWRAGFAVAILERPAPIAVRRRVSFSEAVYDGRTQVEEACAVHVDDAADVRPYTRRGLIPVKVDPGAESLEGLRPWAVVDAIVAKRNMGTSMDLAPLVLALGPGFEAGVDAHAVVETNRGPHLGRVIWHGSAEPNTGEPAVVAGQSGSRVLRSPAAGPLRLQSEIGDIVDTEQVLAHVANQPIRARFRSMVRGLARDGLMVETGMKIGDLDPRLDPRLCCLVSDKSLAVAGGVLEAVLMHLAQETK